MLEEAWDFDSDQVTITPSELLARLRAIQRAVRNRLKHLPFLLQLDIGLHRVSGQHGRRRVCVHFHGLVWGTRADVKAAMNRFGVGHLGAPGGKAKRVIALLGALRYITKDTRCGYVSFWRRNAFEPSPKLDRLFSYREQLTRQNRRFLLDLFGSITKPDLCIASGLGSEILRGARKRAQAEGWTRSDHWRAVDA